MVFDAFLPVFFVAVVFGVLWWFSVGFRRFSLVFGLVFSSF